MTVMGQTSREGGTVIEGVWFTSFGQLYLPFKGLDLFPSFQYLLFFFREIDRHCVCRDLTWRREFDSKRRGDSERREAVLPNDSQHHKARIVSDSRSVSMRMFHTIISKKQNSVFLAFYSKVLIWLEVGVALFSVLITLAMYNKKQTDLVHGAWLFALYTSSASLPSDSSD